MKIKLFGKRATVTLPEPDPKILAQALDNWRATFDSISDMISVHDADHTILRCNKSFAEAFGSTPKELIGKKCYEVVHASNDPVCNCPHSRSMFDKAPVSEEVNDNRLDACLMTTCSPFLDEEGKHMGSVHVARDITAKKNEELEREELLAKLQEAMASVKMLTGLLPICASCKEIRDDKGNWNQMETYIRERTEAEFSHSICPKCTDKLYPGLFDEDELKKLHE